MSSIIMRIRMHYYLWKLEKMWYKNNDTVIGDAAYKFSDTKSKLKALKALQSVKCVTLLYHDNSNRPYAIRPGENSSLYVLERSELWLNRIISFIAGVLTTVAANYIIQYLSLLLSEK